MASKDATIPRLELDTVLANYDSPVLIDRLLTIYQAGNHLSLDALRQAIRKSKEGSNIERHCNLVALLRDVQPSDPLAESDIDWLDQVRKKTKSDAERLNNELSQYKNNLIKESIRMANEDLGNHYVSTGEWVEARKAYTRMREYCISANHLAGMSLKLLYVAIVLQNWSDAQSHRLKLLGITPRDDTGPSYEALQTASGGLIELNTGKYRDAADMFLKVNPSYMNLQPLAGIRFDRILTPNDIATFGGLCALATMSAKELRTHVLENQPFRQFLELESHLRRAINMFCSSKFTSCLAVLDSYAADYSLDLYLHKHWDKLYSLIRSKSLVKWFSAFSVIRLDEVRTAFSPMGGTTLEEELEKMIESGTLNGRIDLADKLLVAPEFDLRTKAIGDALKMAKSQERALRQRLQRMNMQVAGIEVKAPKMVSATGYDDLENVDRASDLLSYHGTRGRRLQGGAGSHMIG